MKTLKLKILERNKKTDDDKKLAGLSLGERVYKKINKNRINLNQFKVMQNWKKFIADNKKKPKFVDKCEQIVNWWKVKELRKTNSK